MKVKAVLFDLGGTLMNQGSFAEITVETFHKILKAKGIRKTKTSLKKAILETDSELKRQFGVDVPKDIDYYTRWNLEVLHRLGIHENDSVLAEEINRNWFDYMEIRPCPGVHDVLGKLSDRGIKLGIITNGYESDLEKILPKLKVQEFLDVLVAADTLGVKKPDPSVFLHALRKLDVSAGEAIFVGDEFEIDYVGAKKAGLTPFLIKSGKESGEKCLPRDLNVIHDLPELLQKLGL